MYPIKNFTVGYAGRIEAIKASDKPYSFRPLPMTRIESSILIHAPLEKMFTRIAQHDHCSDWLAFVTSATYTSEGRIGVGASAHHLGKIMGRKMEWDGRIIEWVENERIVWKATSGLPERMRMRAVNWVRGEGDGTRYGLEVEYHPPYSVFGKIMDSMMIKRSLRKSLQKSTQNLKRILEQEGMDRAQTSPKIGLS